MISSDEILMSLPAQSQPAMISNLVSTDSKKGSNFVDSAPATLMSTTEKKTQMLLRQIQELQPMVLEAQTKNR